MLLIPHVKCILITQKLVEIFKNSTNSRKNQFIYSVRVSVFIIISSKITNKQNQK